LVVLCEPNILNLISQRLNNYYQIQTKCHSALYKLCTCKFRPTKRAPIPIGAAASNSTAADRRTIVAAPVVPLRLHLHLRRFQPVTSRERTQARSVAHVQMRSATSTSTRLHKAASFPRRDGGSPARSPQPAARSHLLEVACCCCCCWPVHAMHHAHESNRSAATVRAASGSGRRSCCTSSTGHDPIVLPPPAAVCVAPAVARRC